MGVGGGEGRKKGRRRKKKRRRKRKKSGNKRNDRGREQGKKKKKKKKRRQAGMELDAYPWLCSHEEVKQGSSLWSWSRGSYSLRTAFGKKVGDLISKNLKVRTELPE